jgi:hypothetical protein
MDKKIIALVLVVGVCSVLATLSEYPQQQQGEGIWHLIKPNRFYNEYILFCNIG